MSELDITNASLKIEKTEFTMFNKEVKEFLEKKGLKDVVLFGVEVIFFFQKNLLIRIWSFNKLINIFKTHVCILQTALNLLKNGYSVHLVADACSSRSLTDRLFALERLRQMGCVVTTHESVIFQLLGDKNHEKFKEIQAIVKEKSPDTGLLLRASSI